MKNFFKCTCLLKIIISLFFNFNAVDSISASGADLIDEITIESIQEFVQKEMDRLSIPGAALAIVCGDSILFSQGFGIADPSGRQVTADTPFILGSTTKSFTALAIMQLVECACLNLDEPVYHYLPWFNVTDKDMPSPILVRHLLNHTSGISQKQGVKALGEFNKDEQALEKYVRSLKKNVLNRPVGQRFEYSNTNYAILGLLVQETSKIPYEQYIQKNIFSPLGMNSSFTSPEQARKHGIATGYRSIFNRPVPSPNLRYARCMIPAGYLVSSARDLARYLILHLEGGRYKTVELLSSSGIHKMHNSYVEMSSRESYAMGWVVGKVGKEKIIWHNGGAPNYYSYLAMLPESKYGIVFLTNALNFFKLNQMDNIALGIIQLIQNSQVAPSPSDEQNMFVFVILTFILVAQLVWMISGLVRNRWKQGDKQKKQTMINHILLSVLLNFFLIIILLLGVPGLIGSSLRVMMLFAPDFTILIWASAGFALIWLILRNALALYWLRKQFVKKITYD